MVVSDKVEAFTKTKEAVTFLRKTHAWADVEKVIKSRRYRSGKGKSRNRRYKKKLGPLVVYNQVCCARRRRGLRAPLQDNGIKRAFRNIPGVDFMQVDRMNLLKLAPGGHLGRFVIWTEGAFRKLDAITGTWKSKSQTKNDWNLPQSKVRVTVLAKGYGILYVGDVRRLHAPHPLGGDRQGRARRQGQPARRTQEVERAQAPQRHEEVEPLQGGAFTLPSGLRVRALGQRLNVRNHIPCSQVLKRAAILRSQKVISSKIQKASAKKGAAKAK